ncbi:MAG: transglutaminase domain-containing protein [Oscillospiraceae bacterium]|nr:transglutaminase domain-containing protein [Oscillospiraceae bacterium]
MNINDTLQYLNTGLPEDIQRLKLWGDFEGATRLIDLRLQENNLPKALRCCLTAQREMIKRLPEEYPYTKEEALAIIREYIPDYSEEEFERDADMRRIYWIYHHGEKRYFGRFFSSMCKAVPGFADRACIHIPGAEAAIKGSRNDSVLDSVAGKMKERGCVTNRIRIRATMRVKDDIFTPGMYLRAHLPIPAECEQQSDIRFEKISHNGQIAPADAPQRTICWEGNFVENPEFEVVYSYLHTAKYHDTESMKGDVEQPDFLTGEIQPHVVFSPFIRELTAELTAGLTDPMEKARAFYDFITLNMNYTFMPAYFVMESIPENCARNFTGDCGVFSMLFLTLCRCAGIPAHWQSGLTAEPTFCGAHDWVCFYVAPHGWLYADTSYGISAARIGNEARRKFYFGNLDPYRMVANSDLQGNFTIPKEYWRADPYDNQVGEIETSQRGLTYSEFVRFKEVISCEEV